MAHECPLSTSLTMKDVQSGFAGETGTVWTIAPDCSFTIARQLGSKILASHKRGRLTPAQQTHLKEMVDRMSGTELSRQLGGAPQVNARRISLSYGGRETALTLAPGGGDVGGLRPSVEDARTKHVLDLAAAIKDMLGS
jgi:hypothetical protein